MNRNIPLSHGSVNQKSAMGIFAISFTLSPAVNFDPGAWASSGKNSTQSPSERRSVSPLPE